MRLLRVPGGHLALAAVLVLLLLALRWPLVLLSVPAPALLTGRLSRDPRVAGAVYSVIALVGAGFLVLDGHPVGMWVTGGSVAVFALLLPWLLGLYLRSTSALERAGWERARTLERESLLMAEQARMRERSRIARDLHDAVGHELSLLTLGAGALEMASDLSEERRVQAGQLRETAGRAAEQLMVAVGVLRADTEPAPLGPVGDSVTELVRHSSEAGLEASLEWDGTPHELPVIADRALYRVVQEALTNAAKHAPGSAPRVVLRGTPDGIRVRVTNPVPGEGRAPRRAPGAGSGLVGLRERVRLVGGGLRAGIEGGDWVVSAFVPASGPGEHALDRPPEASLAAEAATAAGAAAAVPEAAGSAAPGETATGEGAAGGGEGALVHRRIRRRTLWAISTIVTVPILMAMVGYALVVLATVHQASTATLAPEVFERLRPGQDRAEAEAVLPEGDLYQSAFAEGSRPEAPEGLECRYYRDSPDVFTSEYDRYRLCFDSETLVSTEVLTW